MRVLLACLALIASAAAADYAEVTSGRGWIKTEPTGDGERILQPEVGDLYPLVELGQTGGYYHIRLPGGGDGFIYRTFVRMHEGDMPVSTAGQDAWRDRHLSIGRPMAEVVLVREGYVVGVDARLKIPAWVQYELSQDDLDGPAIRGNRGFRKDNDMPGPAQARNTDYTNSTFDRGHMAPAEDMTRSEQVMRDSFLVTNCAPQIGDDFNGAIWATLEEAVRDWVRVRGDLTVITGPVFDVTPLARPNNEGPTGEVRFEVVGEGFVAVPNAFFKIVVDAEADEALAFLMPNADLTGRTIDEFLVSIDEIERRTGLDFLAAFDEDREDELEDHVATGLWPD